eukprot:438991-Rhodomonas_salina.3
MSAMCNCAACAVQHATITSYDGKTKTAFALFGNGPSAGTTYAIAHVGVDATGYMVGDAGYVPMMELPPAAESESVYGYVSECAVRFWHSRCSYTSAA